MFLLLILLQVACQSSPSQPQNDESDIEAPPITGLPQFSDPIPQYSKLEFGFEVQTRAQNLQFPYDPAPPPGIEPGIGVSVDLLFTPDDWETVFIQPAFHFQQFEQEVHDGEQWLYPTDDYEWRVRFTPHLPGEWQYKARMQDAAGEYESLPSRFMVTAVADPGFIRVSEADRRYFEFEDGTYFPGIGVNLSLADELNELPQLEANSMQLIRTYLPSQYSIWGAAWSPWRAVGAVAVGQENNARLRYDAAAPFNRTAEDAPLAVPGHDFFLWLSHDETVLDDGQQWRHLPCAVLGWNTPQISVKPNSSYRLRVRYRLEDVQGPKSPEQPLGLTVKTDNWLWHRSDETQRCTAPGAGNLLAASYNDAQTTPDPTYEGWQLLETTFDTADQRFLPRLWLALENATFGHALIDHVWIEEVLPDGEYGPNVVFKASMAPHLYFDQRSSFAFDQALETVEAHDLYLKLVLMEKGDYALGAFEADGSLTMAGANQSGLFFGNGRSPTKIRWLQQAYWRYVQARWGYSTHIHSWELLNEGPPGNEAHHILADELGRYMAESFIPEGQTTPHPNTHLVTTSVWSGYPQPFWQSEAYPNIDYADIHHYAREAPQRPFNQIYDGSEFYDAAAFTIQLSEAIGGSPERNPGMPLVLGETGFIFANGDLFAQGAADGLWLHNLLWARLNGGGMMELYWTGAPVRGQLWSDTHDYRPIYGAYGRFVQQLPLNNGRYQPLTTQLPSEQLRLVGQIDSEAGQAHLWLQNRQHTWKNVVDGVEMTAVSGPVQLFGFAPNQRYRVRWVDTYALEGDPTLSEEVVQSDANGTITLILDALATDVAAMIDAAPQE